MSVLYAQNKKVKYPFKHDPQSKKYYSFGLRPVTRENSKEYLLDDLVKLSSANGFYYVCIKPGLSTSSPPTFSTEIDGETTDGTVTWKAVAYDLELRTGDTFTSTWTGATGVTVDNPGYDDNLSWVRVTAVPTSNTFELNCHITVTRADAKVEEYDRTLVVPILEL